MRTQPLHTHSSLNTCTRTTRPACLCGHSSIPLVQPSAVVADCEDDLGDAPQCYLLLLFQRQVWFVTNTITLWVCWASQRLEDDEGAWRQVLVHCTDEQIPAGKSRTAHRSRSAITKHAVLLVGIRPPSLPRSAVDAEQVAAAPPTVCADARPCGVGGGGSVMMCTRQ